MAAGASLLLAAAPARAAITYVGRVASTTVTAASTSTVLTAGRTVTAGDAIVVAVLLSSTSTTAAKVVDSAGNTYALDRDQNDGSAGDRVVVFSATNAKALPSGGTITITYPSSAECNASADEFTGIAALERAASAFATSTSFNSGASGTTSQASELIFGVVGNESGNAPVFAAGWTALPTLSIVDDRLTVAYQVASTTGSFTASGTISGTWMAAVLAYPASGSPPPPDQPPVAVLAVSQAASPPLTVNASAAGSTDTDSTPIASYSFNWGDGSNATLVNAPNQTASHTYSSAGTYTVTLIATDTANLGSTPVTKNITVAAAPPPDQPPVAVLAVSQAASPPLTVNASAAGSTDTDSTPIASYSFDWGDGSSATVVNAPNQTASHTYSSAGTYTVTLIATDTANLGSTPVTKSITFAADVAPVAALAVTQAASPPLTVNASAAGSTDTDAWPIASYSFSWGDGSSATVVNAPNQTASHTYSVAGTYTVSLTATDTNNLASTPVTKSITVSPSSSANTVESRIAASSDDAAETSRRVTLTGTSLPLASSQTVGMRWTGLAIPPGATITTAWIQFSSTVAASGSTSLTLHAQAADNATTFTTGSRNISSRALTSASTAWSPAAWNANETATAERTPDLKAVVQEVVNRSAWASGNALAVIVTGSGSRTAGSFDGNAAQAALLHVEYSAAAPPPDQPPVAVLAVSQAASPPLTVNASAAGSTDTDSTPIASYSFDWGDGSNATLVNAPNQTASHTYSSAGTYTVTLIATDTANLGSTPVTKNITLTADAPPVAQLAVTPSGLTANASAAGSTDTDAWPIASYSFSWGDGSSATVVNAPNQTASHTYSSGGTYTVTLTAKDTGGLTSAPVTQSVTVSSTSTSPTAVYVGYYDTHHAVNTQPKPDPWQGSPNVVFIGTSDHNDNNWDSSCIRVDNLTSGTLSGVVVTADLGSSHFALWGTNSIPAGYHLILAQTTYQNFDGSDTNPAGCYGCNPNLCLTERSSDIPVVHVTVNSTTKDYLDKGQVMNTGGYDGAGCPYVGGSLPTTRYDESHAWAQVFTASGASIVAAPSAVTSTPPNHPRVLSLAAPWPNPARGVLALRFSLPAQGPAWLGLYDVSGRVVRTFVNNVMEAGDYDLRQDVSDVSPGVYFVRLVTPGATMHERLIVEP